MKAVHEPFDLGLQVSESQRGASDVLSQDYVMGLPNSNLEVEARYSDDEHNFIFYVTNHKVRMIQQS